MRTRESLRVLTNALELARSAAEVVLERAHAAIGARGCFHLALAGGSTPRACYAELAGRRADFGRWHAWFGDERCVPPEHSDSNFGMATGSGLLERLPAHQVHRLRGESPDLRAEAERYEQELRSVLGEPPHLDLVLLGLGADGHTASLFPGSRALDERTWVTLGSAPHAPHERLTLTLPTLAAARELIFLVEGADKAPALASALATPQAGLPAARAYPTEGDLLWLVDRAASAHLPGKG